MCSFEPTEAFLSSKKDKMFEKARNYAFNLLKFRPRSEYELCQRLKQKKFSAPIIESILTFLKEKDLVNDETFARMWVESRVKKPLGSRRLKQELIAKGIKRELIIKVLEELSAKYNEDLLLRDLISQRLKNLRDLEPQRAKRRLYAYLLRRGFSSEAISEAINQQWESFGGKTSED